MSKHYTAVLEINVTEHTPERKEYANTIPAKREVSEVTKLVLKANTIEALSKKLINHVALIEED